MNKNRIKHILAVADKTKENAECFGVNPDDAYLVGFLHDIGYEYNSLMHNVAGGMLLEKNKFKYWEEIYWHGVPNSNYQSNMLDLLNFADLTTDYNGVDVTFDERINNIKIRYGEESKQYSEAEKLAKEIKEKIKKYDLKK